MNSLPFFFNEKCLLRIAQDARKHLNISNRIFITPKNHSTGKLGIYARSGVIQITGEVLIK